MIDYNTVIVLRREIITIYNTVISTEARYEIVELGFYFIPLEVLRLFGGLSVLCIPICFQVNYIYKL